MSDEAIQIFRELLPSGANRVESLERSRDISNTAASLGSGGGQRFNPPREGGGMGSWESGVERQLGALDARAGRIEDKVSDIRETVAGMKSKVDDLPTKWFMVTAIFVIVGAISAFTKLVL